jgi:hypothetical protein
MSFDSIQVIRLVEHAHGHLGWLAAASLLHPAILLRNRKRRAHLSVVLATLFVTLVGSIGVLLYGPYRDILKQRLFIDAPSVGLLFERKEHLAFGAIVLAWSGAVAYAVANGVGESLREPLRTFAYRAFVVATALAVGTAALGTVVAAYRTF